MTRTWAEPERKNAGGWVMICDEDDCPTRSEVFRDQPPLNEFRVRGWYIAEKYGDVCPACLHKKLTEAMDLVTQLRLKLSEVKFRTAPGEVHSLAETGWQLLEALDKVVDGHRGNLPPLSPAEAEKS